VRKVGRDCAVYVKYEGLNPTGSFKDRGMTMAISKAAEAGAQAVICASTGNTSAAAAAYAARANMTCIVLLPAGKIALGKLAQAFMYGSKVVAIDGNFDDALRLVREIGETEPIAIVNSINPHRIEGQKTASFEIIDVLGDAPDIHILPVGNAGNISAYWKGYEDFRKLGKSSRSPRMVGFQAAGSAPIYHNQGGRESRDHRHGHPHRKSRELGIRDRRDARLRRLCGHRDRRRDPRRPALARRKRRHLRRTRQRGQHRGLFKSLATPGAGSPFPALAAGSRIVCTVTGHGLKDPDVAKDSIRASSPPRRRKSAILQLIGG
jgi:threonine synthase